MSHRSYRDAGHLPKQRPDGEAADPAGLPRQRRGVTPQMRGRYPDYDVLADAGHWDEVTRRTVLARVDDVPPIRFFTEAEARCLGAFLDVALGQDAEPRIPVLAMVDAKFHRGERDGFRFDGMPDDGEAWRLVARGLDESAGSPGFAAQPAELQRRLVDRMSRGDLRGGAWDALDPRRVWTVVMRVALGAFYSHPWAWNEIGFGGPAYPYGYLRLGGGPAGRDPHEGREAFDVDPVQDLDRSGS